ncbi:MAG: alpha/beta hydrolase, partial [Rickettsiales bacterium]|nr:alpha/beta hydrolase [Rickettsiales bacterium]
MKCNKVEYHYLESGQGPTLFLLHGYPDNAYSWEHQIRFLSAQGYRVIAPFLRGYAPTITPENSYFDRATLATDVAYLIKELNEGEPIYLVGQDWGAPVAWHTALLHEDTCRAVMGMSVPYTRMDDWN